MANSTRSLRQATYTPVIAPSQAGPDAGGRGLEKCSFVRQLAPSAEELDSLAKPYAAADTPPAKQALTAVKLLQAMAGQRSQRVACAHVLAQVESATLSRIAGDLSKLRERELEEVLEFCRWIRRAEGLPFALDGTSARAALDWALQHQVATEKAQRFAALATALGLDLTRLTIPQVCHELPLRLAALQGAATGFAESMRTPPVGYLHLERLAFTPAGIERGELSYSVPLSPGEEVNISHREWSHTSEEFEKIVTDYLEEYSEEGVTEKSELAESVASQTQHSSAFNTGVTASGGYGGITITASVGYNAAQSSTKSSELSRSHSADVTHKASSRSKKEHKISFKVASAAETEDQSVRRIRNPYQDRAVRIDYFQLIRKWQVDLYRYGMRLTWDITIPEPGSGLLSKMMEIERLRKELEIGFDAVFPLKPQDITRHNYDAKGAQYGVPVEEPPPVADSSVLVVDTKDWAAQCGGHTISYVVDVVIPDDYRVTARAYLDYHQDKCPGEGWGVVVQDLSGEPHTRLYNNDRGTVHEEVNTYGGWAGRTGKLAVWVKAWDVKHWAMSIRVETTLQEAAFKGWQQRVWKAIRDGVQAQYYENRQRLQDRLSRLQEELGAQDTLSLRKREREEVMKGVLRWMGIEDFVFFPAGMPAQLEEDLYRPETGLVSDPAAMNVLLAHGEKIRFLHHAIEWENMLFFLYPYFWCHPQRWEFKKYIDHPDPLHRCFLKSGSARVVLTIRPGFEDAFLAFINTGDMNALPPSPYLEIGQEFKQYAQTNYPGIPPANPVESTRPLLHPLQQRTWAAMQDLIALLGRYAQDHAGACPTTAQGLAALAPYVDAAVPVVPLKDPWGHDFRYVSPGVHGEYDLSSLGADGAEGGEGEDADIEAWAEAALIGRWHEYTPTSALDIVLEAGPPVAGGADPQPGSGGGTAGLPANEPLSLLQIGIALTLALLVAVAWRVFTL